MLGIEDFTIFFYFYCLMQYQSNFCIKLFTFSIAEENIFQVILDLFRAGSDTTATSISWATLYLVKFPDIQEALREEIDKVSV